MCRSFFFSWSLFRSTVLPITQSSSGIYGVSGISMDIPEISMFQDPATHCHQIRRHTLTFYLVLCCELSCVLTWEQVCNYLDIPRIQRRWITPILHCKIRLCFWSFFQLLLRSMHGKHNILYQTGYIHHTKPFLWLFIEFSKLAHFLTIILKIPPLKEEANPMGVTSVVTYTFSIGPFAVSPWSR